MCCTECLVDGSEAEVRLGPSRHQAGPSPGTLPCPQRWGMLWVGCTLCHGSADLRAALRQGNILWQHPLRSSGLQLNKWKKIHLASKILTFKAISSPGWPGWSSYGKRNWNEQNIWRGRMKTGQLGKQMFFLLIMLRTLSNGSPWSFLIKQVAYGTYVQMDWQGQRCDSANLKVVLDLIHI